MRLEKNTVFTSPNVTSGERKYKADPDLLDQQNHVILNVQP